MDETIEEYQERLKKWIDEHEQNKKIIPTIDNGGEK